ncbi:hypothetical protein GALMADRAFT_82133 [Galerina marginata CBS 339.88]|uniref:DUF6593 domain-containing protein n=1 Tax=Galerina marginata (strain CBS 339.88) TaxID=685588 RepID=A0A067S5R5_GALM3|nr:hypothetical protein GALMADRAFT_82133 [Galerina marginata CBS 339.88]
MYTNNPYAQAGWKNPQNVNSINEIPWPKSPVSPPTFGILPSQQDATTILKFTFTLFNPDICSCLITGPNNLKFFEVSTTGHTTSISKPGGRFATIQWARRPSVEAKGIIAQQPTAQFLRLSADQKYRTMTIGGKTYAWVPHAKGTYLYSTGTNSPEELARISLSSDVCKVVLELTSEAFHAGIFEACVVSTVLLYSGRSLQ